jgi:vancomycin resistance protein VanW
MARKLFCDIHPIAYWLSVKKCRLLRRIKNLASTEKIARQQQNELLPVFIAAYELTLCREADGFNPLMERNKAHNVAIANRHISHLIIKPGETFSFWALVGSCTVKKGYRDAWVLIGDKLTKGLGGGLCQTSNIIHYLVHHTMLTITEHHSHDCYDLYPEYGKQLPFGMGASIVDDYKDFRFINNTADTYQIILKINGADLYGEIRCSQKPAETWKVVPQKFYFSREAGGVYRNGKNEKHLIDEKTGQVLSTVTIKEYHARVTYDASNLEIRK